MDLGFPVYTIDAKQFERVKPLEPTPLSPGSDEVSQRPSQHSTVTITRSGYSAGPDEKTAQFASQFESMQTWMQDVTQTATPFIKAMEALETKAAFELPWMLTQDWELSVDANNEVVVLGENLSAFDIDTIKEFAGTFDIAAKGAAMRDSTLKAMEQDRGPLMMTHGLGRFDLTKDNFQDIVQLRELAANTPAIGKSPYNPNPEKVDYFGSFVAKTLTSQLELRAEVRYDVPPPISLYI
ncbi:hypothetical protein BGP77_08415 [Saccharospirillum sp. MSK14-1]|nr:hypothetical protein BGP77_08415 [Saccharospirillum sp. MSK14-1]